jgi:hypothetical protein
MVINIDEICNSGEDEFCRVEKSNWAMGGFSHGKSEPLERRLHLETIATRRRANYRPT